MWCIIGMELSVSGLSGECVEEVIEEQILRMGHVLVERGVGLVACQKCVHPRLKDYFQREVE